MDFDRIFTHDLPAGFGIELAQNPDAMQRFQQLDSVGRADLIRRLRAAGSEDERRAVMNSVIAGSGGLNP